MHGPAKRTNVDDSESVGMRSEHFPQGSCPFLAQRVNYTVEAVFKVLISPEERRKDQGLGTLIAQCKGCPREKQHWDEQSIPNTCGLPLC